MVIPRIDKTFRNIQRYRQIVNVFLKYGFGHLLERMNISAYLDMGRKIFSKKGEVAIYLTFAQKVKLAFEELGPTFIKLGQILSLRSFSIPLELISELTKLQDRALPMSFEIVRKIVEKELSGSLDNFFIQFHEDPLASASIAQTHRAVTKQGEEVVIKIQRPGIKKIIETDMEILMDFAQLLEKYIPEIRQYDPTGIVDQLANTTLKELDFQHEARNIEIFSNNFKNDHSVYIMKVIWSLSTSRVLTLERIQGIKISDVEKLHDENYDMKQISINGCNAILKQVFEFGFFHADPHPGNLFVLPGNIIAPVDFGMMGRLDNEMVENISNLLISIVNKDIDGILRFFIINDALGSEVDVRFLRSDISDFLDRYYGIPLVRLNIKSIVQDLFIRFQRHKIRIKSEYLILAKALVIYEDVGRKLNPELDMIEAAKPYIKKILWQRYQPEKIGRNIYKTLKDYNRLLKIMPVDLEILFKKLKQGKLGFEYTFKDFDQFLLEFEKSSNRIAFSLIIGGLLVASSLMIGLGKGPLIFGYPIIGVMGFLFAGLLGIWLLIAIIRSGRL